MIPYSKMIREEQKKLTFLRIGDKESLTEVQNRVCRELTKSLVDGEKNSDIRNFECSFDDSRLYEFQWIERRNGFAHFAAFVEPKEITRFVIESRKYANEIGFDPLFPGDMEVTTEVFVYSPNSFPSKGLKSLLKKDADIVLVTTGNVVDKYQLEQM